MEQAKTIRELEIVVRGYEDNLGEPLRAVREDVEKEWVDKFEAEVKRRVEKEVWAGELVRQLEREKKVRVKLEEERRALAAFVSKFDSLGFGPSKLKPPMPIAGGATTAFAERKQNKGITLNDDDSPVKIEVHRIKGQPSLLEQMPEEEWSMVEDLSFEEKDFKAGLKSKTKGILGQKENVPV